jgi:hypothetical protein
LGINTQPSSLTQKRRHKTTGTPSQRYRKILPCPSNEDTNSKGDNGDEELSLEDLEKMEEGKLIEILQNSQEEDFFDDSSRSSSLMSSTDDIVDFDESGASLKTSVHTMLSLPEFFTNQTGGHYKKNGNESEQKKDADSVTSHGPTRQPTSASLGRQNRSIHLQRDEAPCSQLY